MGTSHLFPLTSSLLPLTSRHLPPSEHGEEVEAVTAALLQRHCCAKHHPA